MILIESVSDEHYYIVFGWKDHYMRDSADFIEKFDIYDDAVSEYERISSAYKVTKIYEVTDGIYKDIEDEL